MLSECLVYSSMRLEVSVIAPRQLGAGGDNLGRQFQPSVEWRTGQSGAPPDSYCSLSDARFPSKSGTVDRYSSGPVGAPDTVRCIPDSPVPPADRWSCHASPADFTTDRWRWRPLAHRTVRCTTGQSGVATSPFPFPESDKIAADDSPDSPVNYSRTPSSIPESGLFTRDQPGAPDTVWCTTGQSGVPVRAAIWLLTAKSFAIRFLSFRHCF
jgi:hypothetical protein